MSLVTVQRSPSGAGSTNSTLSDDDAEVRENETFEKSECFFTGKGTALILALREIPHHIAERRKSSDTEKYAGNICANLDIQHHLQSMFYLLRHEDTLKMAVKLESQRPNRTRYLAIISRPCCKKNNGLNISSGSRLLMSSKKSKKSSTITTYQSDNSYDETQSQDNSKYEGVTLITTTDLHHDLIRIDDNKQKIDEDSTSITTVATTNIIDSPLQYSNKSSTTKRNINCDIPIIKESSSNRTDPVELEESCLLGIDCNEKTTIGLVLKVLADTTIRLDGDGGFSISIYGKTHIFKPVSVQAMWSALQTLHKVSQKARDNNFYPGGPSHEWVSYYENRIESDRSCLNEWNTMDNLESRRPPSPDAIESKPTKREETKQVIRMKLKEIMMCVDLDEVTSKYIRSRLEEHLDMDLAEFKSFIDEEMLTILGQMDAPTEIFEHVYLGSEWNASNLEELQKNGVRHILNVTREIDNFFPGMFDYFNVRVYDDEKTNLLKHWDNTFKYISRAKAEGSKVLVHCKMGVSRSASVVIAYAMKAYNWDFNYALKHVKERRSCVKPNKSFLAQLETYRGMLDAMQNKEKLQRSKSETNLKSTKDARLIPGSEPTPLIQALNNSSQKESLSSPTSTTPIIVTSPITADTSTSVHSLLSSPIHHSLSSSSTSSSSNFRSTTIKRSNSSLSRNYLDVSLSTTSSTLSSSSNSMTTTISKHQSYSLEDLAVNHHQDQRNVRYPATNGQNYSLTQNQIIHIQRDNSPPVKMIVDELKSQNDDVKEKVILMDEKNSDNSEGLIWTSSSQLIRQSTNIDIAPVAAINPVIISPAAAANADITAINVHNQTNSHCPNVTVATSIESQQQQECSDTTTMPDYFSSQLDNIFENEDTTKTDSNKNHQKSILTSSNPMWTTSTAILDFNTSTTTSLMSRQSSCSSVDSAVFVGGNYSTGEITSEIPSRQSSWGSGDNRISLPSRNSSWGSYDTSRSSITLSTVHNKASKQLKTHYHQQGDAIINLLPRGTETIAAVPSNEKDIEPLSSPSSLLSSTAMTGTVKKTKQKLEKNSPMLQIKSEIKEDKLVLNFCQNAAAKNVAVSNTAAINTVATNAVNISLRADITNNNKEQLVKEVIKSKSKNRSNSEEIIFYNTAKDIGRGRKDEDTDNSSSWKVQKLSASAPETFSIETYAKVMQQQQQHQSKKKKHIKDYNKTENASYVQNLKKNFEAKATVINYNYSSKKGQSLPSSPIASHSGSGGQKDLNVKDLVTKYQASEPLQQQRQQHSLISNRIRPRSFYESRNTQTIGDVDRTSSITKFITRNRKDITTTATQPRPPPTTISLTASQTNSCNTNANITAANASVTAIATTGVTTTITNSDQQQLTEINRPPPIPPTAKIPMNHHHPHHISMTDGILSQNFHQRKLQHYGKTHPLARLSFCKKKLNAAATYNTM